MINVRLERLRVYDFCVQAGEGTRKFTKMTKLLRNFVGLIVIVF